MKLKITTKKIQRPPFSIHIPSSFDLYFNNIPSLADQYSMSIAPIFHPYSIIFLSIFHQKSINIASIFHRRIHSHSIKIPSTLNQCPPYIPQTFPAKSIRIPSILHRSSIPKITKRCKKQRILERRHK